MVRVSVQEATLFDEVWSILSWFSMTWARTFPFLGRAEGKPLKHMGITWDSNIYVSVLL